MAQSKPKLDSKRSKLAFTIGWLFAWTLRLAWLVCVGAWLGTAYFVAMSLMSPFGTLKSSKVTRNTKKIMFPF